MFWKVTPVTGGQKGWPGIYVQLIGAYLRDSGAAKTADGYLRDSGDPNTLWFQESGSGAHLIRDL
jgi:hypothetical protein